jgi:hypothetical protein
MAIRIEPLTKDLVPAVKEFNQRLEAGGCHAYQFPESEIPLWLPRIEDRKIYQEYFAAVEDDSVRGAYILKHQEFSFRGRILSIGFFHLPISEGIVNRAYGGLGLRLLLDALRRQPYLFALGMGGYDEPLPKLLKGLRWNLFAVPFYFKVVHPARFLRNIQFLRNTRLRRLAMDVLAASGLGWLGIKTAHAFLRRTRRPAGVEVVDEFGAWADELWNRCQTSYGMAAVRDCTVLNILYPRENRRFIRVRISQGGRVQGWAVLLNTLMSDHKYFGNLRLGSIVDCLAAPEDAAPVIAGATAVLQKLGVDLLASNQSHAAWCAALKASGFIQGPSNFLFAASEKLSQLLSPFGENRTQLHLNRGDGDGPIHL